MQIPTPGGPSNYQPEGLGWDLSPCNGIIRKSKNEFFVICYREHCPCGSILMINVGDNIIKSNGKDLSRFICYSRWRKLSSGIARVKNVTELNSYPFPPKIVAQTC